ncbi:MAG: hypothetical protein AW09_000994 [Candidatus Accumulibacter phosphatis]|jgi:hypothetical protein|uniref:Uncharacterized protein n=1 Tax=Candidatus Accumulibacter phosphatis TaxID=327160 RepID=A0A080LXV7_9PROT|nr:hypothetical protein [Accumulibacter sp.]KFB73747.1 MAG: hypothetical protein AW09_000994 [Candidatus Accumulibacter phosphatis]
MRNEIGQMKTLVAGVLRSVLAASPENNGTFRLVVTTSIGDTSKPVLIVGNAHRRFEDAHGIAVLNPDQRLLDEIRPGVGYNHGILKEIVSGRCDAMVDVWLVGDNVRQGCTYRARQKRPASFMVR